MKSNSYSRRELMKKLSLTMMGTTLLTDLSATEIESDYFDQTVKPIHIMNGQGKVGKIGGIDFIAKLDKSQTGGLMSCDEATLKPGFLSAPPHLHKQTDEICYVLEGTVTILVGETTEEVKKGDWHLRPKGVMHTFWNAGTETAKFIDIYLPGIHEEYMQDLAKLFENNKQPQKEDFVALALKHDIVYFWEKLPDIMAAHNVHL